MIGLPGGAVYLRSGDSSADSGGAAGSGCCSTMRGERAAFGGLLLLLPVTMPDGDGYGCGGQIVQIYTH